VLRQALAVMPPGTWPRAPTVLRTMAEKRATFACTPLLQRPRQVIGPGLVAVGDYVEGPYPATLEGALRSAEAAVAGIAAVPGLRR
jgi:hydroxysqualene dehydroxylase